MTKKKETAKQAVSVMGMVRDVLVDFGATQEEVPEVWTNTEDKPTGRKVEVDMVQAAEMALFVSAARDWALVSGTFVNPQRKSNATRHALRIAKEFATIGGVTIQATETKRGRKATPKGDEVKGVLPTEPVTDLEPGDEVEVVRHVTRYGLDQVDRFAAKIKGKTKKGEYWVTDKESGSCRAARPTEIVVVKRARDAAETEETKKPKRVKKEA